MSDFIGRTGGCQCGAVRYRLRDEPLMLYACHCTDCQKQSASAFGLSLIVATGDLEFVAGEELLKRWETQGEDGAPKPGYFCAHCGTRLYHGDLARDSQVSVKGGSLDRTDDLEPIAHIWLRSAQPWIEIDRQAVACFDTEPDDRMDLRQRWRARRKRVESRG